MTESEAMQNATAKGYEFLATVERERFNTSAFQDALTMVAKKLRYGLNGALYEIHIGKERVHIYAEAGVYPGKPREGAQFQTFHTIGAEAE